MEQESTIEERTGTTEQESLANEQETNEQESIGSEQAGENEAESSFTSEVQTSEAESTVSEGTGATDSEGGKREITWADDLQVENDATVGGTLRAHKECLPKGDRPMKNGSAIYSTGAAYAHTPTHIGVDDSRHAEGNVDVTLLNADGEAVGSTSSIPIGMTDADKAIVAEEGKKSRAYTDDRIAALGTVYIGKGDSVNYAQRAGSAVHADRAANLDSDSSDWKKIMEMTGDKYLRKDQDDETEHKLTMGAAHVKNDFAVGEFVKSLYTGKGAGIDENGNAEVESLRVRSSMDVLELIVNRLSAIEGDQLLTESDTIESVTKDNDGTYTLKLKSKWDGYFTAQAENSVLKGIINTLAQGSGEYHTAWFRVNSVNTANNSINVTMYPDDETPAGKNYEPQALMKIARWGNATDPTRQSCIYLSSTEGRIVKLVNVTKPIIDKTNYGTTWGSLPDFVKSLKDDDGNLLPLRDGLDYLYAPGIVTMDIVRLNKWTNKRLPTYVDRGAFAKGSKYYCEATNPDTGEYETSDVWYYGCKWRCCKNLTSTAPAWNNTDWAMVEGNPEFSVDFAEAEFVVDPDNVHIPLTLVAKLYNMDVTDDIKTEDMAWTRYSEDADGNERTALDNQWTLKHAGAGKAITLTKDDMDMGAYMPKTIRFTCTATLRDGENNAVATDAVSYEY